jgi:hypothetical protein
LIKLKAQLSDTAGNVLREASDTPKCRVMQVTFYPVNAEVAHRVD